MPFDRITIIGIGLIGSSLARVIRREGLAGHIAVGDASQDHLDAALRLGIADSISTDPATAVEGSDLVVLSVPLGANAEVAKAMAPGLKKGAIVTDVGSAKACVVKDVKPHLPEGVHLVPGHPVAGTEHSGPEAGFPDLFEGRWCILTPVPDEDPQALELVKELWEAAGSKIQVMDPEHHDVVLAVTSHLPHLIAYTIVDTAYELEDDIRQEVIKFSAGGFRDFTRIAASDPVMWRDVFLLNREAVLEMLSRFSEDLTALRKAIRKGDGETLQEVFTRTREIRRGVIEAKQD